MKRYVKKATGGNMLTAAAPFVGMIPGYGQIAAPIMTIAGSLLDQQEQKRIAKNQNQANFMLDQANSSSSNYGVMSKGGPLMEFEGPKHENGGIKLPGLGVEVEGGENLNKNNMYVNSDRIGYDKDGYLTSNPKNVIKTFAEKAKAINSKYKNKKSIEEANGERLAQDQINKDNETIRTSMQPKTMSAEGMPQMALGGLAGGDPIKIPTSTDYSYGSSEAPSLNTEPAITTEADNLTQDNTNTEKKKKKKSNPLSLGDQMTLYGALMGAVAQLPALTSKPSKEVARTISPSIDYTKYNPNAELEAVNSSYNNYRSDVLNSGVGTSTNTSRLLAGLGQTQSAQANVLRNAQQQNFARRQSALGTLNQANQYNAQVRTRVDEATKANQAANLMMKQQSMLNIGQQAASTGQYFNSLDGQKLKLKLLNELYTKYGLSADSLQGLLNSEEMTKFKE